MSNGDFEVMPRGTMEELKALRSFVKDLSEMTRALNGIPDDVKVKVSEIERFYYYHNEKYSMV